MTLMVYSLVEKRWRHVNQSSTSSGSGSGSNNSGGNGGGNNRGIGNGVPSFGDDSAISPEMNSVVSGMNERAAADSGRVSGGGILRPGRLSVTGTPPPGRNGHTATLATSGPSGDNARIVIIGGWLGTGPLAASDMHVLDISGGVDSLRWYQPVSSLASFMRHIYLHSLNISISHLH